MAKKSKTQRAKASEARQQRKVEREREDIAPAEEIVPVVEEKPKKSLFKKSSTEDAASKSDEKKPVKKADEKKKPKKKRFQFFRDVKSEMKRVTWPSRTDVIRWSGVVVVALLFFGIFVAVLDNALITPLLFLVSGIGA